MPMLSGKPTGWRNGQRPACRSNSQQPKTTLPHLSDRFCYPQGGEKEAVSSCSGVLTELRTDLEGLTSEADELRAFGNEALGENERLQKENEELRKSCEDAVLDQCVTSPSQALAASAS